MGPDFWRFFLGQLTSQLGSSLTHFTLPLVVYHVTGSATSLAVTVAAATLPYAALSLPAGALMDRIDRRRAMIWADLVRAAVLLCAPILAAAGHLSVAWLYAIAFVMGTASSLFDVGTFAAIPALVNDRAQITRANARLHASQAAMLVIGPVLAAGALALTSAVNLLYIDAATFLISVWSLHTIRRSFNTATSAPPVPARSIGGRILDDVVEGLRFVWRHRVLRALSLMLMVANAFDSTASTQLVVLSKSAFRATDSEFAILCAAGGLGASLLAFCAGPLHRRWSFGAVAISMLAVEGVMLICLGLANSLAAAAMSWGAACGAGTILNISTSSLRQTIVPNELLGRARGAAILLGQATITLGTLCGGAYIAASHDVVGAYVVGGAATFAVAIVFIWSPLIGRKPEPVVGSSPGADRPAREEPAAAVPGAGGAPGVS